MDYKKKINYTATGLVYGKYWGGGKGAYKAIQLTGKIKNVMLKNASKDLDALDDGMGYEKVLGAIYNIEKTTAIEINKKEYTNREYETVFLGNLTEEQQDFLLKCVLDN